MHPSSWFDNLQYAVHLLTAKWTAKFLQKQSEFVITIFHYTVTQHYKMHVGTQNTSEGNALRTLVLNLCADVSVVCLLVATHQYVTESWLLGQDKKSKYDSGPKYSVCSAASRCVILLLVDNPFTFTHSFVVFCWATCFSAYTSIMWLTYMFLNYCTVVFV
jgi:hypothetical protein